MAKMSHIRLHELDCHSDREKWKIHDLTLEKTRKSNVIGEGIDLIAELIIWGAKHNWIYDKSNMIDTETKLTKTEKDRRNEALCLLAQIQDMNSGVSDEGKAFSIILSIFPELKQYFGSYISIQKNEDMLITNVEQITLNNAERKRSAIMEQIKNSKNKIVYKINYTDQFFTDILDCLPNYRINNKQINKDNLTELNNMVQHNNTEIINNVLLLLEQKNTNNSEELYDNINNLLQKNKKLVTPLIIEMQKPDNKKKHSLILIRYMKNHYFH